MVIVTVAVRYSGVAFANYVIKIGKKSEFDGFLFFPRFKVLLIQKHNIFIDVFLSVCLPVYHKFKLL